MTLLILDRLLGDVLADLLQGEAEGAIGQSSEPAKTTGPGGERERTA